ncbi:MAG TPA: hypothetical protein VNN17_09010, partial [Terriglobia bacterium]|nr:hypothetical protein [Terriglobia bacterium]
MRSRKPERTRIRIGLAITVWGALLPLGYAGDPEIFPLATGNYWVLENPATRMSLAVRVQDSQPIGPKRIVKILLTSPHWEVGFLVSANEDRLVLEGLDYSVARFYSDDPGVLFSDRSLPGEQWQNPLGTVAMLGENLRITAPAGTYAKARHFRIRFTDGNVMDWYLVSGIGVVRIDSNQLPYLLASYFATTALPPQGQTVSGSCPKIGVLPNPPAGGDFSPAGQMARLMESLNAGSRFLHISASWAELEPQPESYHLAEIERYMQWAEQFGMEAALTIKTIDSTTLALPADLQNQALDSPAVIARFHKLLRQITPRMTAAVRWVNLANEVNIFFASQPQQIIPFLTLYQAGLSELRARGRVMPVGMTFSFADFRRDDSYFRILSPYSEVISFTYYPFKRDGTTRGPEVVGGDLGEMVRAAQGKPLVLTEVGHPTSPLVGSSLSMQQQFFEN